MNLKEAKKIGTSVLNELNQFIERGELAGSIRRKKPNVNDIDLVFLPKKEFMMLEKIRSILKRYGNADVEGTKIIRIDSKEGINIDCYIANEKNYEVLWKEPRLFAILDICDA